MKKNEISIWEKYTLTIEEAAVYFHIGQKKLRRLTEENRFTDYKSNENNNFKRFNAFYNYLCENP